MTKDLADELERLAKEATPGEWSLSAPDREGYAYIDAPTHGALARVVWHMEDDKYLGRPSVREQANAALIVALRNALPDILSALRREEWQGIETVVVEARDAVAFLDRVRAASSDEQIAVGQDHWNRAEAALRAAAALAKPEGEPVAWPDREAVARAIAEEFCRQDYGDPSAPGWTPWSEETPMWWPYVDAGPVDLGRLADAILALPQAGEVK